MRGYYAGLKCCMAGLALVCDMTVNCFLSGGEMINVMWQVSGFRSLQDFCREASSARGLDRGVLKKIDATIKNAKVSIRHLGHWRKARSLGPPSNHPDSAFLQADGRRVTVADYFAAMCRDQAKGGRYRSALGSSGTLKYPFLPCVNIGTTAKPCWVPAELVVIPGGQSRSNECTGEMTADMIKYGIWNKLLFVAF